MEGKPKWTPGPWYVLGDGRTVLVRTGDDGEARYVCEVGDTCEATEGDDPVADANARLIAAAPAMAEALRKIEALTDRPRRDDESDRDLLDEIGQLALAALALAETGGA